MCMERSKTIKRGAKPKMRIFHIGEREGHGYKNVVVVDLKRVPKHGQRQGEGIPTSLCEENGCVCVCVCVCACVCVCEVLPL